MVDTRRPPAPSPEVWEWQPQAACRDTEHGLAGVLSSVMRETLSDEGYRSIIEVIELLLDAGKRAGTVR